MNFVKRLTLWRAYCQLMRLDKPIGSILLWLPTACALLIANQGHPPSYLVAYFFVGTILMRSAGCIINDIADRNFDGFVVRTKNRPLPAKAINLSHAILLLSMLLLAAAIILLQLNTASWPWALVGLLITFIYPFAKRFIKAPQLFLGLAFSMGIPMAYTASSVAFNLPMLWLFLANFLWIVAYDTVYAMADRTDDAKLNLGSTALLFGKYLRGVIIGLQIIVQAIWLWLGCILNLNVMFYLLWGLAGLALLWQQRLINQAQFTKAFQSNSVYGILLWVGLIIAIGH